MKYIDRFTNLDVKQLFVSTEELDDSDVDAGLEVKRENFVDTLIEKTNECTTNYYLFLVIIFIIVLYLVSRDKPSVTYLS